MWVCGWVCGRMGSVKPLSVLLRLFSVPVLHTVDSLPVLRVTTVTCPVHTLSSSAVGSRRVWLQGERERETVKQSNCWRTMVTDV